MNVVSSVQCVNLHLLINHLVVKMINSFVENVTINNLHHVVTNVIKSLNQVRIIRFVLIFSLIKRIDFHLGTKKLEYHGQQFHEHCFTCYSCTQPIGTKSFIPKEQRSYCVPCYEEHFATKCTLCSKVKMKNIRWLIIIWNEIRISTIVFSGHCSRWCDV